MTGEGYSIKEIVGVRVEDYYMSLKALSAYAGISEGTLKGHLHDPRYPIPHFKMGEAQNSRILVRKREFDKWMERHRVTSTDAGPKVNQVVEEVMAGLVR